MNLNEAFWEATKPAHTSFILIETSQDLQAALPFCLASYLAVYERDVTVVACATRGDAIEISNNVHCLLSKHGFERPSGPWPFEINGSPLHLATNLTVVDTTDQYVPSVHAILRVWAGRMASFCPRHNIVVFARDATEFQAECERQGLQAWGHWRVLRPE